MDIGLQWAVPDSACGEAPHGRPDAFVPGRDPGHAGDPRVDRTKLHHLTDILVLAVICGADSFVAIALFGQLNEAWLRTFPALLREIPSHDTLDRFFVRLDTVGKDHGRIETRRCGNRVTTDTCGFISSLPTRAQPLLQAVAGTGASKTPTTGSWT